MLKRFRLAEGKLVLDGDSGPVLMYVNPDETERKLLVEQHHLDEHTLASALDPDELGRLEVEPDHLALIFKRPKRYVSEDNFLFKVASAGLFLFSDKLVVVVSDEFGIFEGRQFSRVQSLPDLLLRILYRFVVHFEEHLKTIGMISDELEKRVTATMENRNLVHMFTLEKGLVYYLNAIHSNARVLDRVKMHAQRLALTAENLEYVDDLVIENNQCQEQANTYSQVLSSLMNARASLISNNLNVLMKNLNALVIAVAIPSFFAGVGGMSEFTSFTQGVHPVLAYAGFLLAMVGLGVLTYTLVKRLERLWR